MKHMMEYWDEGAGTDSIVFTKGPVGKKYALKTNDLFAFAFFRRSNITTDALVVRNLGICVFKLKILHILYFK